MVRLSVMVDTIEIATPALTISDRLQFSLDICSAPRESSPSLIISLATASAAASTESVKSVKPSHSLPVLLKEVWVVELLTEEN